MVKRSCLPDSDLERINFILKLGVEQKESRDERICRFCESGNIEDEDHVLWLCDNFQRECQLGFYQRRNMDFNEELLKNQCMCNKECAPYISCFLN